MTNSFIHFAAFAIPWLLSIGLQPIAAHWLWNRPSGARIRKSLRVLLISVAWTLGLVVCFAAQFVREMAWLTSHPNGVVTEKDMLEISDYPNVLAGWISIGWIPVTVGFFLTRKFYPTNPALDENLANNP